MRDAAAGYSLTIKPSPPYPTDHERYYIHFVRVDSSHYNVFAIGDDALLTEETLSKSSLADQFDVEPPPGALAKDLTD